MTIENILTDANKKIQIKNIEMNDKIPKDVKKELIDYLEKIHGEK